MQAAWGSSTTASSKNDAHVKTAKQLLVDIVKIQATGDQPEVLPQPEPKKVNTEKGVAVGKLEGKTRRRTATGRSASWRRSARMRRPSRTRA